MKPHPLFTSEAPMGIQEKCCRGDPIHIGAPFLWVKASCNLQISLLPTGSHTLTILFFVNNSYMWCPSLRFSTRSLNTTVRRLQDISLILTRSTPWDLHGRLQETLNPTLRRQGQREMGSPLQHSIPSPNTQPVDKQQFMKQVKKLNQLASLGVGS